MDTKHLSEREVRVLEEIVRNYILNATPTGSRSVSKRCNMNLSPASIRNIMGDLEEAGYITHPHTSAGRVPTDKGYRYYVDHLMERFELPEPICRQIHDNLAGTEPSDLHLLMEATSKALSTATHQLGVILAPKLSRGIFRHVHIFPPEPKRYCIHLTIDSGFVKTMAVELETDLSLSRLESACRAINERFSGKTLRELQEAGERIFEDVGEYEVRIIRLFIPTIHRMIAESDEWDVVAQGEANILLQPEFFKREAVGALVELLEEKRLLLHLLSSQSRPGDDGVAISIGGEIEDGQFRSFSIVSTGYQLGNMEGRLGIIGPKRMPYPLLVSAVDYTAKVLGEIYS
jgi:heat-inducible transcriptional repressor